MIQGAPSERRTFLDSLVLLLDPTYSSLTKKYRAILNNRNALLAKGFFDDESYMLWSEQLLKTAVLIQKMRREALKHIEREAQQLAAELMPREENTFLTITYTCARPYSDIHDINTFEELVQRYPKLREHEMRHRRSLFGAHLDDFRITFLGKECRTYSSRGQQKLVLFLLKLAQLQHLKSVGILGTILLVDDFITDFDVERSKALVPLITKLSSQVILTTPLEGSLLQGHLFQQFHSAEAQVIEINHYSTPLKKPSPSQQDTNL